MRVLKFGGTSVGSPDAIKHLISIVQKSVEGEEAIALVFSAVGGVTNLLIKAGEKAALGDPTYTTEVDQINQKHVDIIEALLDAQGQSKAHAHLKIQLNQFLDLLHSIFTLQELSLKSLDRVMSFGERCSAPILSAILNHNGLKTYLVNSAEIIKTDSNHGNAEVNLEKTYALIKETIKLNPREKTIPVINGFVSSDDNNQITTLGRGGSDYTAALIGTALNALQIEIWTDVNGMMTADPRAVKNAHSLRQISYHEAMELSHFGAKVIYPPTLMPAFNSNIPILIKNTFNADHPGTVITDKGMNNGHLIKGISSIKNLHLLTISGLFMGVTGAAARVFSALAEKKVNIVLITQSSSEHTICLGISPEQSTIAQKQIEETFAHEISRGLLEPVSIESDKAVLAIIGENMRNTPGISSKLFGALGNNGVNIKAISQGSSEMNISVVIDQTDLTKALNSVHQAFFSEDVKALNVFLSGVGLIGKTLIEQIKNQATYLINEKLLEIRIIGMSNSRKMIFNKEGLGLDKAFEHMMENGEVADVERFVDQMIEMNFENAVFVDCTSSKTIASQYEKILSHAVSIVTPNKLANSSDLGDYKKLKRLAFMHGVKFCYETNVGAGLPVINTLNDLRDSGDEFYAIEGVLSGTMSYIYNSFDENTSFAEAVKLAKEKGFTEPDPREDLGGNDVARKILILAREAGFSVEPHQVQMDPVLPEACLQAKDIPSFFDTLVAENEYFENIRKEAADQNKKLRFIAKADNLNVTVSLQAVDASHPFYSLSGSDNIVSFTTRRYQERPLVIKGPGAGAEVTAAGVFSEIISISKYLYQGVRNEKPKEL